MKRALEKEGEECVVVSSPPAHNETKDSSSTSSTTTTITTTSSTRGNGNNGDTPKVKRPKTQASLASFFSLAKKDSKEPAPASIPQRQAHKAQQTEEQQQQQQYKGTDLDFFPDGDWKDALSGEFAKPYFGSLMKFVATERKNKTVFPPQEDVFSAFRLTPLSQVKAVILGQDPYINPGEAHGLCFSVRRGVRVPPSLARIYTTLERTVPGFVRPHHGCLEEWARAGVFMPNATLTVEKGKSNSHAKAGWQTFTDAVIATVNARCNNVVFILWGKFAQKKAAMVDRSRHLVLEGPHPSPLAGSAFLSYNHFAQANEYLVSHGKQPIDWSLSS